MEIYLLKSAACLAFLMLFYKLLLEKESIHVFKRYYLLAAVIVSGIIPLITFQTYVKAAPLLPEVETWMNFSETTSKNDYNWSNTIIWSIYLSGAALFSLKFLRNLFVIIGRIRKNHKIQIEKVSAVLLPENLPPHTFWNYMFLNKQKFQKGQIPKEVLEHEKAHAIQKHSLDILFLELLQIVFWFNPLIYLTKKLVKLNHEFLADSAVLKKGINTASYQELLLSFSSPKLQSSLINSINYSLIKKRFTVMKTRTSKRASTLKALLLLPLLAGLLYSFSTRERLYTAINSEERELIQEKVTPEMLAEYNTWAKEIKAAKGEKTVTQSTLDRMRYIFKIMTPEQKRNAESFPNLDEEKIEVIHENRQPEQSEAMRERNQERMAIKEERQAQKEERRAVREEREMERAERRQVEVERRIQRDIPSPPPPPPAPPVAGNADASAPPSVPQHAGIPAPPPPPPSPVEAVEGWIEDGATFFYNGEKVTGQRALQVVKENNGKNLRVQVEENASGKTVRLSDNKR